MDWFLSISAIILPPLNYIKKQFIRTIDLRGVNNFGLIINHKNYINFLKHETGPYTVISIAVRERGQIRHFNKVLENTDKEYKIKFRNNRKNYLLKFPDKSTMIINKKKETHFLSYEFFRNAGSNN